MGISLSKSYKVLVFASTLSYFLLSCGTENTSSSLTNQASLENSEKRFVRSEPIKPITVPSLNSAMVDLGRALFHENSLSKDNSVSCASCHNLNIGGVDNKARSIGVKGQKGDINTPTVFNSSNNFKQFWDGRAEDLATQVFEPIHNPVEMGSSWEEVVGKLSKDKNYLAKFNELFADGITSDNITKAIVEFENSLTTPSRFDDYLLGDDNAITDQEKLGFSLFKKYGCSSCHQGVNVGGNMFQKFGLTRNYFEERGNITEKDYGRYNVTGEEFDKFLFKVPSLRNVALTAPYLHDGSQKTLESTVEIMAEYQLGRTIPAEDVASIVLFLKTLTGKNLDSYATAKAN